MKSLFTATALAILAGAAPAGAQGRAAMVQTSAGEGAPGALARAFDRVARARLEALSPVPMDAAPPLSLSDLQLAVGCVGESVECLSSVAERIGVDVLLVPEVELAGATRVASIIRFDRSDGRTRRAVRRADGEAELLDQAGSMIRELFDLPEPEPEEDGGGSLGGGPGNGPGASGSGAGAGGTNGGAGGPSGEGSASLPLGPTIVAGTGVALLVAGGVFGVLAQQGEDAYRETDTETREGVLAAQDELDAAERNALLANVLFAVGGAAVAGALVWWLVGDESPVSASVAPDGVFVAASGTFGGGW